MGSAGCSDADSDETFRLNSFYLLLDEPWEYLFFLDIEGNLSDANVLIALGRVLSQSSFFKLLGNYPASK